MIENEIAKLEKPDQDAVQLLRVAEACEMFFVVVEIFVTLWHGGSPSFAVASPSCGGRDRAHCLGTIECHWSGVLPLE